jgi:nucleotide-binding universal stress UspA family protein
MLGRPLSLARSPFRSIVAATDLSSASDAALARAFSLPLSDDACVRVVHVAAPDASPTEEDALWRDLRAQVERVRPRGATAHATAIVTRGETAVEVDLLARFTEAELLVVPRTAWGAPDQGVATLLALTNHPLLVVSGTPVAAPYDRALVAVDFELVSADLLVLAARVVAQDASEVTVLHAFEVPMEGLSGLFSNELNAWGRRFQLEAQTRLQEVMSAVPWSGVPWRCELAPGDAAAAIASAAAERRAALVVVGTHQRRGIARLLSGSVCHRVLEETTCDVLVLPAPGHERAFPPRTEREHHRAQP